MARNSRSRGRTTRSSCRGAERAQDHEVVGVTDQPEVAESRILSVPWFGPLTPVAGDQSQRPPAPVRVGARRPSAAGVGPSCGA